MEISENTLIVFHVSRFFGLAPYYFVRNSKGFLTDFRFSKIWFVYSFILVTTCVIFNFNGILFDMSSKKPLRMKTATSKVVTTLDITVVVCGSLSGVLCGFFGLRKTREMNRRLREADDYLASYTDDVKDKRRSIFILLGVLIGITATIGFDLGAWHRIAKKMTTADVDVFTNLRGYIPFYFLYYILMVLHVQLAQSALGIGRRFRRLNLALKNAFPDAVEKTTRVQIVRVPSLRDVNQAVDDLAHKTKNVTTISSITQGSTSPPIKARQTLEQLTIIHASLSKAVDTVSDTYGPAMLAVLGSCLLHLVATSYFFLVEVLGENDKPFSMLQSLWLTVHFSRLLLIVEPCHITYVEAKNTTNIICDVMRHCKDNTLRDTMELFWQQLLVQKSYFNAVGMCKIDREILTSYCGAIATYLVILIQFQKSDG